jgi:hypothetical protein
VTKEDLECYKYKLINDSGGSLKDQNADRNVDSKYCTCDLSDGNQDSTGLEALNVSLWQRTGLHFVHVLRL